MSTTTIRLPADLKARIDRLSAARGSTAHAFMLEAINEVADRLESHQDFVDEAERRLKKMARTGEYLNMDDIRDYAQALARGEQPARPTPRSMEPDELARFRASMRRMG
jgi:predicted transcriptional regulator